MSVEMEIASYIDSLSVPKPRFYKIDRQVIDQKTFHVQLQTFNNSLICFNCPYVSYLTMKHINLELSKSLTSKKDALKKLKLKYDRRVGNVNMTPVQSVILSDFEENLDFNNSVQLISGSQAILMSSSGEMNLLKVLMKQFENSTLNLPIVNLLESVVSIVKDACGREFTKLHFINEDKSVLDANITKLIVQVWQIFTQYFMQFNYIDFLRNFDTIKLKTDPKDILSTLKVLLDIGNPYNC